MLKRLLKRFPRANEAYQLYRESRLWHQTAVQTPHGFQLVGNAAMQSGAFEPQETAIVARLLDEVDVLVNVGANIGYYCCMALQRQKRVIAFEPMPGNLRCFTRNMQLNQWQNQVELYPIALGTDHRLIEIYGGGTGASVVQGWAGQEDHISVPMSTIDSVIGQRLAGQRALVLIDVEGAELGVLQGATALLKSQPGAKWLVEITVAEHQPSGVAVNPNLVATFELFQKFGYQALAADDSLRSIHLDEVRAIAATGKDTLGTHNFIFQQPDD